MSSVPRVLTIAGSDSGGGAGIQADLKTFAACGVFGMTVITAITAQNTKEVRDVHPVPPEVVRSQIRAVVEDIGVDAVKTGMLFSEDIIRVVSEELDQTRAPVVVDPVMIAKSGSPLLKPEAMEAMKKYMVPRSTVITPNAHEAGRLTGVRINTVDDMVEAGRRLVELGARYAVVKGGHVTTGDEVVDVLVSREGVRFYKARRVGRRTTHGTGCTFASAIASYIALGYDVPEAVKKAKELVTEAIRLGYELGGGVGPVNHLALLYRESERYLVIKELRKAIEMLEGEGLVSNLIPESQMNIVYSLTSPRDEGDVAGVPGRVVKVGGRVKASSDPDFGASRHVAKAVVTAARYDPGIRSAANIRFSEEVLELLREMGLSISYYDRRAEPPEIKSREGATIPWGVEEAIKKLSGRVPDVVYHRGDYGKEPMIIIFGRTPIEVAERIITLSRLLTKARGGGHEMV